MAESEGCLHVTGLPKGADENLVKTTFGAYGAVTSVKMLPPRSDKPDVAAIVVMQNPAQATWLIENVSGKVPQGFFEPLTITKKMNNSGFGKGDGKGYGGMPPWAMMQMMQWFKGGKGKGGGKGWGGGGGGLSSFPAEKKVWIGGLPEEGVTFEQLKEHFSGSKFAAVMKGKGVGTGGVAFATPEEATAAIQTLNGSVLAGATIEVDVWTKKEAVAVEEAPTEKAD